MQNDVVFCKLSESLTEHHAQSEAVTTQVQAENVDADPGADNKDTSMQGITRQEGYLEEAFDNTLKACSDTPLLDLRKAYKNYHIQSLELDDGKNFVIILRQGPRQDASAGASSIREESTKEPSSEDDVNGIPKTAPATKGLNGELRSEI